MASAIASSRAFFSPVESGASLVEAFRARSNFSCVDAAFAVVLVMLVAISVARLAEGNRFQFYASWRAQFPGDGGRSRWRRGLRLRWPAWRRAIWRSCRRVQARFCRYTALR